MTFSVDNKDMEQSDDFDKDVAEETQRVKKLWGVRDKAPQPKPGFGRLERRTRSHDRESNPLEAHVRHRQENAQDQQRRMAMIGKEEHRANAKEQVDRYYEAWGEALQNAQSRRYNDSDRNYERMVADKKIDPRLISKDQRDEIRTEAIREATRVSNMRIEEINTVMPQKIDRTIDDAVKLHHSRDAQAPAHEPGHGRAQGYGRSGQEHTQTRNTGPEIER
jgi:hypothetical protein